MGEARRQEIVCRVVEEVKEGSVVGEGTGDHVAPQSCKPLGTLVRVSILF